MPPNLALEWTWPSSSAADFKRPASSSLSAVVYSYILAVPRGRFRRRGGGGSGLSGAATLAGGELEEILGHSDSPRISDGGLGRGDQVGAGVETAKLRGFAEAVENRGDEGPTLRPRAVVILSS